MMAPYSKEDRNQNTPGNRTDSANFGELAGTSGEMLKPDERIQLKKCEDVIRTGFQTFFEVGEALLTIREARLYREVFPTFEAYCRERWVISRSHAWHLMGAAERIKLLPHDTKTPKPANEFQVRPFLKLEPGAFPKAWEHVISTAKGGKITPALVRGVVAQLAPQNKAKRQNGRKRKKTPKLPKGCSIGGILVLLDDAKKGIRKGDMGTALASIDRIEAELLGMCGA